MPTPLPSETDVDLRPPGPDEVAATSRAVATAVAPAGGLTALQRLLLEALFPAMTGYPALLAGADVPPSGLGAILARRNAAYRVRIVQIMVLGALVVRPLPPDVAERVAAYAAELGVEEGTLSVARDFADGSLGLAAVDFERNGYVAELAGTTPTALHTSRALETAWAFSVADDDLADRWRALEGLPDGSLGRRVTEFYRARGFVYPGLRGSAPPLLAQHDWVHVLADYGTTVESELEVFAFIARANDDLRAFSLLAMVVSLFETGYLASGLGLFEAFPGQLERDGMATRLADAMRRGALCSGSVDFLTTDWFSLAEAPVEEVRRHFAVPDKAATARRAGSVGPWDAGGISPFQRSSGVKLADAEGRPYESFGAEPAV